MDEQDELKFPCIYDLDCKLVSVDDCSECLRHDHCDIYASMLDEKYYY